MAGFGAYLQSLREAKGWTQEYVEEHHGIAQTTLSGLEGGRITRTSDANMAKLALAYRVTRAEMYSKAGLIEDLDTLLERPPSADDPIWLMAERVRRDHELMRQLAALEEASPPEVFDVTIEAVAEAWHANLKMGVKVAEAKPRVSGP